MTTSDYLTQLQQDKQDLVDNLTEKGITGLTGDETFTELVPEVLNIPNGGLDWSAIGYSETPENITDGYNYAVQIKNNWVNESDLESKFQNDNNLVYMPLVNTSNATTMQKMFYGASKLIQIPLLDTSNVTIFGNLFNGCTNLEIVPILNTSKVTNMYNMITNCKYLTDESLDNILQMCVNATLYRQAKTLVRLGISSVEMQTIYSTSRIQALPHYQNFINAGWTIGY